MSQENPSTWPFVSWSGEIKNNVVYYNTTGTLGSLLLSDKKKESTLFDDIEEKMLGKGSVPKLNDIQIMNIRSILSLIYNTFSSKAPFLNCFFTNGKDQEKDCFLYLHSLPIIKLSLAKDGSSTVIISSDWHGDRRQYDGWDAIPINETEVFDSNKKNTNYQAYGVLSVKDVIEINIYHWGFEILSKSNVQFVAILSYALEDKKNININCPGWKYPFKQNVISDPDSMKIIASWKLQN